MGAMGMAAFTGYFMIPNMAAPFIDREDTIQVEHRERQLNAWKDYKIGLIKSEIDGIARLKEQTAGLAMVQEQRKNNIALALEAEHMISWIDREVQAAIAKRSAKEDLSAAIEQLKA